jgi:hypothetical protein
VPVGLLAFAVGQTADEGEQVGRRVEVPGGKEVLEEPHPGDLDDVGRIEFGPEQDAHPPADHAAKGGVVAADNRAGRLLAALPGAAEKVREVLIAGGHDGQSRLAPVAGGSAGKTTSRVV